MLDIQENTNTFCGYGSDRYVSMREEHRVQEQARWKEPREFGVGGLRLSQGNRLPGRLGRASLRVSTTLEYEADPTFENEATGSSSPSLPRLGF